MFGNVYCVQCVAVFIHLSCLFAARFKLSKLRVCVCVCVCGGQAYPEGQTWYDGCNYVCVCSCVQCVCTKVRCMQDRLGWLYVCVPSCVQFVLTEDRCMQDRCGILVVTMSVSVHACSVCVPRPGVCRRTDVV